MASSSSGTPSLTLSRSTSPILGPPAQPDHFFQIDSSHSHPSTPHSDSARGVWLCPEDDPLATRGVPVFKPTLEEFRDFEGYMTRVEGWGMRSGIVKIIPPKEWTDSLPPITEQLKDVRLKHPIEQVMMGRSGLYRQQNMEKNRTMTLREWAEMCGKEEYRAPAADEVELKSGGSVSFPKKRGRKKPTQADTVVSPEGVADAVPDIRPLEDGTPAPVEECVNESLDSAECSVSTPVPETPLEPPTKKRRGPTRVERDAAMAKRLQLNDEFLDQFDPSADWLPPFTDKDVYTPEFCAKLERRYWRNCGLGKPAWYGADMSGSLFTNDTKCWNVAHLPSTLSRLLPQTAAGLPGVNTPYLYFGMWRATFAWHVEDMDLFSINYIHFGAGKFWYAIPQGKAVQLENTMRSFFPRDTSQCSQFLRHKSFLASPTLLSQSSCKPNVLVQHAGEFVVTFPRGYHAGFNLGFNCAESVNFALESWLDLGRKAAVCSCVGDSVRIDVDQLLRDREAEELDLMEDTEVGFDDEDSDAPSSKRKATSPPTLSGPPKVAKRVKVTHQSAVPGPSTPRVTLKIPGLKAIESYPCCLCISTEIDGLLPVNSKPDPKSGHTNSSGAGVWMAHETCAMVVPETWVDVVDDGEGSMRKVVFGVDAIVKDRWSLKCSACSKSRAKIHGAPIQCTKGRCSKAFHVSCAKDGAANSRFTIGRESEKDVVIVHPPASGPNHSYAPPTLAPAPTPVDIHPIKTDQVGPSLPQMEEAEPSPNGTVLKTIKKLEYELLCSQHNPAVAAAKKANKMDKIRTDLLALPEMSRIKLRVSSGVFEVSLVKVIEDKGTVEVLWDGGRKREFKWGSVIWGQVGEGVGVGTKPSVPAPATAEWPSGLGPASQTLPRYPLPAAPGGPQTHNYTPYSHQFRVFQMPPPSSTQMTYLQASSSTYPYSIPNTTIKVPPAFQPTVLRDQPLPLPPNWACPPPSNVMQPLGPIPSTSTPGVETAAPMSMLAPPQPPEKVPQPIPPEVLAALSDIQKLAGMDRSELESVLNSQPALREGIKMLLSHPDFQLPLRSPNTGPP